jgi:hypothetical protein
MKKIIITFLILFSFNLCFSSSDSVFISSKEYQVLNEKIVQLEKENAELAKDIFRVDGRISDWYLNFTIGAIIFMLLLAGIVGLQWSNTRGIARTQAEKELELLKEKFREIESKSVEAESLINSVVDSMSIISKS